MSTKSIPGSDLPKYESMIDELQKLKQQQSQSAAVDTTEKNGFLALAEMGQDLGIADLAKHHDHYLYGAEKA
ncbi:MAG: hypothetical protein KJ069_22385 [Anaerolineae bacterium]|nr:hypothetical protein [Anaerolineae bacterium]